MRPIARPAIALIVFAAFAYGWLTWNESRTVDTGTAQASAPSVSQAFAEKRSDFWVEDTGTVDRLLRDDNEGRRHQRFVVRMANGMTVLVAHNIDLAPRVPVAVGDVVSIHGKYVWNDKGGLIHWTHEDPRGGGDDGWIRYEGRTYH